jgi:hypothetical protein
VEASAENTRCANRRVTVIAMSIAGFVGLVTGDVMRGDGECWIC